MPWGRVDDTFYRHPKVHELDESMRKGCIALFWLADSWCNDHLTDGRVPAGALRLLGAEAAEADELVRVGLWERDGKGYRIHDFLHFNKSREQVMAERIQRAEAGRLGAAARWTNGVSSSTSPSGSPSTPPSETTGEPTRQNDAPVPRTPSPVTPFPAPDHARDGLPHIDAEAQTFLEGITGRSLATAGDRQLTEYDRQIEDHGLTKVIAAYQKVAKALPGSPARPQARQLVWSALRILEPFANVKDAQKAEVEEEDRRAHRARLERTRRLIDGKSA